MRTVIACVTICVTAFALSSLAAPAAGGEPHAHDGFYFRWTTGVGNAKTKTSDNGVNIEFSGLAGEGDVAIGGMPFKKVPLATHLTLWGWRVSDPDVVDRDLYVSPNGTDVQGVLSAGSVGPGVTYFLPHNGYVSLSAGIGSVSLRRNDDDTKYKTRSGVSVEGLIGKEWWVGPSWGIGLAGGLTYLSAKDQKTDGLFDDKNRWSSLGYSVRLSTSYN